VGRAATDYCGLLGRTPATGDKGRAHATCSRSAPLTPRRLIMAPVFFSAYVYVMLGTAINRLGAQYSVVPPKFVSLRI
jgi:hypothetical protein